VRAPAAFGRWVPPAPDLALIDAFHRAVALWKDERQADLVRYLAEHGLFEDARVWKLAQAFFEILPPAGEDWKLVSALLAERETLRAEAWRAALRETQASLFPPTP
jgi:hypothetical protein